MPFSRPPPPTGMRPSTTASILPLRCLAPRSQRRLRSPPSRCGPAGSGCDRWFSPWASSARPRRVLSSPPTPDLSFTQPYSRSTIQGWPSRRSNRPSPPTGPRGGSNRHPVRRMDRHRGSAGADRWPLDGRGGRGLCQGRERRHGRVHPVLGYQIPLQPPAPSDLHPGLQRWHPAAVQRKAILPAVYLWAFHAVWGSHRGPHCHGRRASLYGHHSYRSWPEATHLQLH
jgi:hypothetical protein